MNLLTTGLDFFYVEVDFFDSDLMLILETKYGVKAPMMVMRLLGKIYGTNYFYRWGEDEMMLFTNRLGREYTVEYVKDVLEELVDRDFFDKGCYEKHHILTSAAIQMHYFEASQRRKAVEVERDYLLMDIKKYKNIQVKGEMMKPVEPDVAAPGVQNADIPEDNVDIQPIQREPAAGNAGISKQMKRNEMEMKTSSSKSSSEGTPGGVVKEEELLNLVPQDGVKRNAQGLWREMEVMRIPASERSKLIKMGNWGEIGHPIWKAIYEINNSGGKINQPAKFIISRLMKRNA